MPSRTVGSSAHKKKPPGDRSRGLRCFLQSGEELVLWLFGYLSWTLAPVVYSVDDLHAFLVYVQLDQRNGI